MKHLILLLLVLGLVASVDAQVFTGQYGQRFNEAQIFYYKSGFTASTANDTTQFFSIAGASDLRVWGTADDSTRVLPYYQLRNSTTGAVTTFAGMDTVGTDGLGSAVTAAGPSTSEMSGGTVALSTIVGFDEIRFYIDYLAGSTAGGDGADAVLKLYLFLVPTVKP